MQERVSEPTRIDLRWMTAPQEPNICPFCGANKGYVPSISKQALVPVARCYKCEDKLRAEREAAILRDNIVNHLIACGIEAVDAKRAIDIPHNALSRVIEAIGGRSLYIYGGCGVGKTSAAVYIIRERMLQQYIAPREAAFLTAKDLCVHIKGGIDVGKGEYDRRLWHLSNIKLLAIDDLMAEAETPNNKDIITAVITDRYKARRQTIITSNYCPGDARKYYGKRIGSRLSAMADVELTGADRRKADDRW